MQPAEPRWCWQISAILVAWCIALRWPDDAATDCPGSFRMETPRSRLAPAVKVGRYPTGFT